MKLKNILTSFVIIAAIANAQDSYIHHEINAKVEPATSYIEVTDDITIPASKFGKDIIFTLNNVLSVTSQTPGIEIKMLQEGTNSEDIGMDREESESSEGVLLNEYQLIYPQNHTGDLNFKLIYNGKIESPIKQSQENYARGFSESPGIISDIGIYLAGSTYWIPHFNEDLITFNLTSSMPLEWKTVSQGTRIKNEDTSGRHIDTWETPNPMEEVFLIAAKFTEYEYSVGAVTAMAFLRTPDKSLANKYLETTAQYLEMYRQLVGPYPYTKFALVENFWETGYGMPSFTLLGEQIIRFPFILHSSYPHELLHNWWGNSVYVDFKTGNWCEGLTAYLADHLISEQRGQGADYRRSTLQRFTSYVNSGNDFPLSKFRSRYDAPSEAIGYGKSLMMWHMLRQELGDENFVKGLQIFYRKNKFKFASFDDIRKSMEEASGKDLKAFFTQWVTRAGAPEIQLHDVLVNSTDSGYTIEFTLSQIQEDEFFNLNMPVIIYSDSGFSKNILEMDQKEEHYTLTVDAKPVRIDVDPEFDLFRRLNFNEIPPALSTALGSEKILIILSSAEDKSVKVLYDSLAQNWLNEKPENYEVKYDKEITSLPSDKAVWIFGWNNKFKNIVSNGLQDYNSALNENSVEIYNKSFVEENNSFVVSVRNPQNPEAAIVWLTIGNNNAVPGLIRKLPHYGKYSFLVFEGEEPANIEKGQWPVVNSPLTKIWATGGETTLSELPKEEPLAKLKPVFSAEQLLAHVKFLASDELKGRGLGTEELNKAAEYIAKQFEDAGLTPGGDNDTYFQAWNEKVGKEGKEFTLKNVIGIIPGTDEKMNGQSVVISAHYDHLGLGWPDVYKGNEGKIHPGADDNASGVAVMIELAKLLAKSEKPKRTIIFVAFTGEEAGLVGSKHFVESYTEFPADKVIANINLDTVGRLLGKKILVLNGDSAKEWKFIFMGVEYVTGISISLVTQPLDASDQMSFVAAGIPAIQLFSGPEEDYHKPTDTYDKIDADGMVKVAAVTKEVIEYLAEREEPLEFAGAKEKSGREKKEQTEKKVRKVSSGTMPDFEYSGEGVKIGAVMPDSPAEKSGLQKGDIIVKLNDIQIKNLTDYSNALKNFNPGDSVQLTYLREGKENKAQIKLEAK
ncbi:MAG: M20/M25/M40 family metallo-hydrolase [Ignavibacteriaceae bacterium]|nr:M20/M25/M40 family metallo-hydrolase [Ignavibacteriaceae bacterium]